MGRDGSVVLVVDDRANRLTLTALLEAEGCAVRAVADARLWRIPVLVISAVEGTASVVRCLELRAEDYVSEPFDPVVLRARINAALARRLLVRRCRRGRAAGGDRVADDPVLDPLPVPCPPGCTENGRWSAGTADGGCSRPCCAAGNLLYLRELAIAALDLSVRTVENPLQRAYEKLGVSGRADLAAALQK